VTTSDASVAALAAARSLLFGPGSRPDRFGKAAAGGSGGVILDLEDAVASAEKEQARVHVDNWLTSGGGGIVRINGLTTSWHDDDVAMLASHDCAVMLPKAEHPGDVQALRAGLRREVAVVVLIETATGVLRAPEICAAAGVARAAFGSVDLAAQLGVDHQDHIPLDQARATIVLASASAGIASPLDGVTTDLLDAERLASAAARAARLGFTGKLCIHPGQIAAVHAAFGPTRDQAAWAERVLASAGRGDVTVVDGQMVDAPVVERARRVLAAWRQSGV